MPDRVPYHGPETNTCPLIDACRFRTVLGRALEAFLNVLDGYTLADLVSNGDDMRRLMGLERPAPVPA